MCSSSLRRVTCDGTLSGSFWHWLCRSKMRRGAPATHAGWLLRRRSIARTASCSTATNLQDARWANSIIAVRTSISPCIGRRPLPSRVKTWNFRLSFGVSRSSSATTKQRSSRSCAGRKASLSISAATITRIRRWSQRPCGPAPRSTRSWIRSSLEAIELPRIHNKHLLQDPGILVRRRPDPEVRNVSVVGHLVRRVASAGNDDRIHVRARAIRTADDISGEVTQQGVCERKNDGPVFRTRRPRVAVRRGQLPENPFTACSQLDQPFEVIVALDGNLHVRPPHMINDDRRRQRPDQRLHHLERLREKVEICVPAERRNLLRDAQNDICLLYT